jgi:hypothetical protein
MVGFSGRSSEDNGHSKMDEPHDQDQYRGMAEEARVHDTLAVSAEDEEVEWFCKILLYLSNKCTIYINNICFLMHCYMFRYLYIILRESLIR